jgi:hypothetical protein
MLNRVNSPASRRTNDTPMSIITWPPPGPRFARGTFIVLFGVGRYGLLPGSRALQPGMHRWLSLGQSLPQLRQRIRSSDILTPLFLLVLKFLIQLSKSGEACGPVPTVASEIASLGKSTLSTFTQRDKLIKLK